MASSGHVSVEGIRYRMAWLLGWLSWDHEWHYIHLRADISSRGVNTTMAIGTAPVYKDTNLHTHIQTNIDFALVWSQASWLGNGSSGHQRRVVFVYLLLLLFRLLIYCLYRSPCAQQPQNFKPPADQGDAYWLRHGSFANFNVSIMFVESNLCRLVLLSTFLYYITVLSNDKRIYSNWSNSLPLL